MSDIFISYEKSDRRTAEMLAQKLVGYGWTTFWDRTIIAGQDWHAKIEEELTDARCVIVLWSRASIKSPFVRDEAREAMRLGVFVPVLIEDIEAPLGFRNIQAADLTNWAGTNSADFHRLITAISGIIGSGRLPNGQESAPRSPAPPIATAATVELGKSPPENQFIQVVCFVLGVLGTSFGMVGLLWMLGERPWVGVLASLAFMIIGLIGFYQSALKDRQNLVVFFVSVFGTSIIMLLMTGKALKSFW
jgi:hypothetical protein